MKNTSFNQRVKGLAKVIFYDYFAGEPGVEGLVGLAGLPGADGKDVSIKNQNSEASL